MKSLPRRSIWSLLLILFSVQIVSANFGLDECQHQSRQTEVIEEGGSLKTGQHFHESQGDFPEDSHCGSLGFCLAGHCHMSHCSVFISAAPVALDSFHFLNIIGSPKEDDWTSLLALERPWQPPRI